MAISLQQSNDHTQKATSIHFTLSSMIVVIRASHSSCLWLSFGTMFCAFVDHFAIWNARIISLWNLINYELWK